MVVVGCNPPLTMESRSLCSDRDIPVVSLHVDNAIHSEKFYHHSTEKRAQWKECFKQLQSKKSQEKVSNDNLKKKKNPPQFGVKETIQ